MIVGTVFLSILNQMEFHLVENRKENCHLVQSRKENCHHDYIPFNVKGNGNVVFSAYVGNALSMRYIAKTFSIDQSCPNLVNSN